MSPGRTGRPRPPLKQASWWGRYKRCEVGGGWPRSGQARGQGRAQRARRPSASPPRPSARARLESKALATLAWCEPMPARGDRGRGGGLCGGPRERLAAHTRTHSYSAALRRGRCPVRGLPPCRHTWGKPVGTDAEEDQYAFGARDGVRALDVRLKPASNPGQASAGRGAGAPVAAATSPPRPPPCAVTASYRWPQWPARPHFPRIWQGDASQARPQLRRSGSIEGRGEAALARQPRPRLARNAPPAEHPPATAATRSPTQPISAPGLNSAFCL